MKRILALDGGGIRGVFAIQIAARLESLFRAEYGRNDLVLADVFDLFAGTSTGAIIATFLAWGAPVEEVEQVYTRRGREIFAPMPWYARWRYKYRAQVIAELFQEKFRDSDGRPARLGSANLRKLLLVVVRNASTGSTWPISSNPLARFNDLSLDDCNLNIPIWQLLRGTTAAPSYFPPEEISLGSQRQLFVDGGITPFNNPALLAILMATLPCYRLNWPAGREMLHVISIGNGAYRSRLPRKRPGSIHLFDHMRFVIPSMLGSVSIEQDLLCRVLGDCLHGGTLDAEVGDLLQPTLLAAHEQKFTYVRYDQSLHDLPGGKAEAARREIKLDSVHQIPFFQNLGREYAQAHVKREHLFERKGGCVE